MYAKRFFLLSLIVTCSIIVREKEIMDYKNYIHNIITRIQDKLNTKGVTYNPLDKKSGLGTNALMELKARKRPVVLDISRLFNSMEQLGIDLNYEKDLAEKAIQSYSKNIENKDIFIVRSQLMQSVQQQKDHWDYRKINEAGRIEVLHIYMIKSC